MVKVCASLVSVSSGVGHPQAWLQTPDSWGVGHPQAWLQTPDSWYAAVTFPSTGTAFALGDHTCRPPRHHFNEAPDSLENLQLLSVETNEQLDDGIATSSIDSLLDSNYLAATYYMLQEHLYSQLQEIVDSVGIDSIPDSTLYNFYISQQHAPIGSFNAVIATAAALNDTSVLTDTGAYSRVLNSLLEENDTIRTSGIYECNERRMNEITFKYLLRDSVNSADKNFIYNLAFSCEYSNGEAVYAARAYYALLFNDDTTQFDDDTICYYSGSTRMMWLPNQASTDTVTSVNKQIVVYPNPAGNTVYFVTLLNQNETGVVDIFDLNGVKLKEIKVGSGSTTNAVLTDNLNDGVYMYRLITDQQFTARGKLAIAR